MISPLSFVAAVYDHDAVDFDGDSRRATGDYFIVRKENHSFDECLAKLMRKAGGLGATALIGMQLVQSRFQWNQRTRLLATAIQI